MSQRSLFEWGVSEKRKADESDLADNAVCAYIGLFWSASAADKETKTLSATTGKTHSRFQDVWFDWLEYDAQSKRMFCKVCHAAKSKNIFSNEGAGVYIFVV